MERELTIDAVLREIDRILDLPPKQSETAVSLWRKLVPKLDQMSHAAEIDEARHRRLVKIAALVRTSASKLARSIVNVKHGGNMRGDWARFAEHDLAVFKDELLALREFIVEEFDFLVFALLRAQLGQLGGTRPERLFEELHEAGAISERTWVLLMSQPSSWREALKDRELSKQLAKISALLIDIQEARKERSDLNREGGKIEKNGRDPLQVKVDDKSSPNQEKETSGRPPEG